MVDNGCNDLMLYCLALVKESLTLYLEGGGNFSLPKIGEEVRRSYQLAKEGEKEEAANCLIATLEQEVGKCLASYSRHYWYISPSYSYKKEEILRYLS